MKVEPVAAGRPPFVYWTCLWAAGIAFALVAVAYDVYLPDPGTPPGRDFSNLYTAGRLALEGSAYLAFDINSFRLALREFVGTLTLQNYSYPPHALFLAVPFALLPYGLSFFLWTIFSAAFFYFAAKPYVRFAPVLAVLTPAACLSMWNGHYGLLIGALWLLYFHNFDRRPYRAGVIASLLTFKPHMGLMVGLTSLTNLRVLLAAAIGTIALVVVSASVFGAGTWFGFIGQTISAQTEILTRENSEFYFRLMPSAYTAYGRGTFAVIAQLGFALAAIVMLVRYRQIEPFALATATFLIVPYVFIYDMTVACLGFGILIWRNWAALKTWERVVLTLAFLSPSINLAFSYWTPPLVPPILLAALYIQTRKA